LTPTASLKHPLIIGVGTGYGNTDWQFLTSKNPMAQLSSPDSAKDQGIAENLFLAYQFSPRFLLEASFTHFSTSFVHFVKGNIYDPNYNAFTLKSHTQTINFSSQLSLPIQHSKFFIYSSLGASITHRNDKLNNRWHLGPLFGGGIGYEPTKKTFTEFGFDYTAGYGEAEVNPANDYIPFTYYIYFQVGTRTNLV
jgi:hypothetical protein